MRSYNSKVCNFQQGSKCISSTFTFHVKLKMYFFVSDALIYLESGNMLLNLRNISGKDSSPGKGSQKIVQGQRKVELNITYISR